MSMSMHLLDGFIETTINRLSSEAGTMRSNFYVDLRDSNRQRITQGFIDQCMNLCNSRGLQAQRNGDGLIVHVDLNTCYMNARQSELFNTALHYTRTYHGNDV